MVDFRTTEMAKHPGLCSLLHFTEGVRVTEYYLSGKGCIYPPTLCMHARACVHVYVCVYTLVCACVCVY